MKAIYDNPETAACQRIRAFLREHPGSTFRDISAGAFVSVHQVRMKCVPLLMRLQLIHVSGLRPTRGRALREYTDGQLTGKPVTPFMCDRERQNRRRREWRQASGFYEARKAARRLANPPDRVLAALMGLAA